MEEALDRPLSSVLPVIQKRIMENTTYHGIPTLKNPLDFWVYQEIICQARPEFIIEIGNLYGGSTLALAHICDSIETGAVIAVDSTHDKIAPAVKNHPRVKLITGDACNVFPQVRTAVSGAKSVMIIEDSLHTCEHTLRVLESYSAVVGIGNYFIVEDGICHHGLDVGPMPGPYEAVEMFLRSHKEFIANRDMENFGITWNPKGYLKRIA